MSKSAISHRAKSKLRYKSKLKFIEDIRKSEMIAEAFNRFSYLIGLGEVGFWAGSLMLMDH